MLKLKLLSVATCAVILCLPQIGIAQSTANRPVMVGGSAEFDACGDIGVPKGLNPRGDNFLALKSAPNLAAKRKAKLRPGQQFYICDQSKDGNWIGVVVPLGNQSIIDCNLGSPILQQQAYRGSCMQGWVAAQYVKAIAG
jgi:hypothetical protein